MLNVGKKSQTQFGIIIFFLPRIVWLCYQDSIYVCTIFVPLFRTKQQGIFVCPRHNNPTLVAFYLPSVTLFTFQIIVNGRHFFQQKMQWNTGWQLAFNAIFMSPPYNKRFAHGNIFFLLVLLFPRSGEKNGNIRIVLYQIMGKQRGLKGGIVRQSGSQSNPKK